MFETLHYCWCHGYCYGVAQLDSLAVKAAVPNPTVRGRPESGFSTSNDCLEIDFYRPTN